MSLDELYRSIQSRFEAGDFTEAEIEASQAAGISRGAGAVWAAKFRLQQARIAVYSGKSPDALTLLQPELPTDEAYPELAVARDSLLALAYTRTGKAKPAEDSIRRAEHECPDELSCGEALLYEGVMDVEKGMFDDAEQAFERSIVAAKASGDRFLQMQALLNTAVVVLQQNHFEDALERFNEASNIAKAIGARMALEKAEGGAGSALYQIGDFKHALANSREAEAHARELGSTIIDQAEWLYDAGLCQYRLNDLSAARASFEQAYRLSRSIQYDAQIGDELTALALLSLEQKDLAGARERIREAKLAAQQTGNNAQLTEPSILEAIIQARQGDSAWARTRLLALLDGSVGVKPMPFEQWQIENELAQLAEAAGDQNDASHWFERSIETYRQQRNDLVQVESRLPFMENGAGLYLDYMEELLREGKVEDALGILDQSRAANLLEAADIKASRETVPAERSVRDARTVASRLQGTILVYCLRPQTSYLWVVTENGTSLFHLPGKEKILPMVESHSKSVLSFRDVLAQENAPGADLYRALIAPASELLRPGGKVFVIADGELNQLNFETLVVPGSRPHFWIEDADVVNAKSLSLLASKGSTRPVAAGKKLLLVGDPVYNRAEYAQLPHATEEVANVARNFPSEQRSMLTREAATRSAYLMSHPGDFRYIHFVAHAIANDTVPLDSAVVLSAQPGEPDVYKLYARDIMNIRLRADLVTISACYGSGVRSYSGEGLVGLAWAFLRAGSHNVVGALWEVSDASTPQLMNDMYGGLAKGQSPDVALRAAKLAMLRRGDVFRKPFYWGAFQLYSGS